MNSKIFKKLYKKNFKNKETALIFKNKKISFLQLISKSKIVAENLSRKNNLLKTILLLLI